MEKSHRGLPRRAKPASPHLLGWRSQFPHGLQPLIGVIRFLLIPSRDLFLTLVHDPSERDKKTWELLRTEGRYEVARREILTTAG